MDLAKRLFPDLSLFYFPMDFTWAVRRAVRRIKPRMLVLAELELWPNLVREVKGSGAVVTVVNGD